MTYKSTYTQCGTEQLNSRVSCMAHNRLKHRGNHAYGLQPVGEKEYATLHTTSHRFSNSYILNG
jgi:hypothetical protein